MSNADDLNLNGDITCNNLTVRGTCTGCGGGGGGGARIYGYQSGTINPITQAITALVQTDANLVAAAGERINLSAFTTVFQQAPFPIAVQFTVLLAMDVSLTPPFGTVLAVSRGAIQPPPVGSLGFEYTMAPMATLIADGLPHTFSLLLSVDISTGTYGIAVTPGAAGSAIHALVGANNQ